MKLFWKYEDIADVKVLQVIQNYNPVYAYSEVFRHDGGRDYIRSPVGEVPTYKTIVFELAFKDGETRRVRRSENSATAKRLLAIAEENERQRLREAERKRLLEAKRREEEEIWRRQEGERKRLEEVKRKQEAAKKRREEAANAQPKEKPPKKPRQIGMRIPDLQKNQLPTGKYKIGELIPAGYYDFEFVYGTGSLYVYDENENLVYKQRMGNERTDQYLNCVNVQCKEGWTLEVCNELVVEIKKAKGIQIDL